MALSITSRLKLSKASSSSDLSGLRLSHLAKPRKSGQKEVGPLMEGIRKQLKGRGKRESFPKAEI